MRGPRTRLHQHTRYLIVPRNGQKEGLGWQNAMAGDRWYMGPFVLMFDGSNHCSASWTGVIIDYYPTCEVVGYKP